MDRGSYQNSGHNNGKKSACAEIPQPASSVRWIPFSLYPGGQSHKSSCCLQYEKPTTGVLFSAEETIAQLHPDRAHHLSRPWPLPETPHCTGGHHCCLHGESTSAENMFPFLPLPHAGCREYAAAHLLKRGGLMLLGMIAPFMRRLLQTIDEREKTSSYVKM